MSYASSLDYTGTTKLASISGAFSKARNQPISRTSRSQNLIWSSTSRPRRPSVSPSQKRCWPPLTR
jgi:hypothetical protein